MANSYRPLIVTTFMVPPPSLTNMTPPFSSTLSLSLRLAARSLNPSSSSFCQSFKYAKPYASRLKSSIASELARHVLKRARRVFQMVPATSNTPKTHTVTNTLM